jgi:hypothetical protein
MVRGSDHSVYSGEDENRAPLTSLKMHVRGEAEVTCMLSRSPGPSGG